jgi:hypothetical protein
MDLRALWFNKMTDAGQALSALFDLGTVFLVF